MRQKQRPIKSSRHKSVTFIIDSPQTSFSDTINHQQPSDHHHNHHHQQQQHQHNHNHQHRDHQFHNHQQHRNHKERQERHFHQHEPREHSITNNNNNDIVPASIRQPTSIIATNDEHPLLRKKFEHNVRHMSDVMRLAFLENNDICPETWADIDFNSLSTASILQRNIQQQLQQQQMQQELQQQQQQQRQQQQQHRYSDQHDWDATVQDFAFDEDYSISDNGIFATATPTTSTNRNTVSSTPRGTASGRKATKNDDLSSRNLSSSQASQSIRIDGSQDSSEGFRCDEPGCGKSFPSLRKLRHHKVVHSDEFPFICEFQGCNKKFKRKFGIDLHSTTHFDLDPDMYTKTSNNSSLPFFGRRMQYSMCKPCGQKFKTVHEYQYHMLKHGKEPFKCPVKGCGQTFSIWKSFQKHRASHYFNYYCKMDPRCDHHTSNLQLLKLHIYCCHFRRTLPENATLASRDSDRDEKIPVKDDELNVVDDEGDSMQEIVDEQPEEFEEIKVEQILVEEDGQEHEVHEEHEEQSTEPPQLEHSPATPRRDSRLRKNPPRSSTFGHQDYASVNNGKSFARAIPPTPPSTKRARSSGSQSAPHDRRPKLPAKVLPKRSAQRLPMSLIAADEVSTEDDDARSSGEGDSFNHDQDDGDQCQDSSGKERFRCHLCDYKFSVRFQLTKHLSTHLELTPEMYSATADAKVIQLSERRRREFYCDKCNVKFEHMPDLDIHMRKHGPRPYVCNFCQTPSTFRMARQYLSHLYEHRFNYKCTMEPDCDFTINRKDALKLHIFRMHLNQQLPSYIENYANMVECNEWSEQ